MFNTKTSLALASATKEQEKAEEDALLSEPHPTTLWKPLGDRNYRYTPLASNIRHHLKRDRCTDDALVEFFYLLFLFV